MPSGSLNKGELGEIYVLLRLVADGRLDLSDAEEKPLPSTYLEVVQAIRKATGRRVVYEVGDRTDASRLIVIRVNDEEAARIEASGFSKHAAEILGYVSRFGGKRTVDLPDEMISFLDSAEVKHYKASSSDKSDIWLTTRDPRTAITSSDTGFSIKTKWAGASTLFNTGSGSRSVYIVDGMTDLLAKEVNAVVDDKGHADVKGRVSKILASGCQLTFDGYTRAQRTGQQTFADNCRFINGDISEMWRAVVMAHFSNDKFSGGNGSMRDISDWLVKEDPCHIGAYKDEMYPVYISNFLFAAYCGLTASRHWNGRSNVNGGLIVVRRDGRVVGFSSLDSDLFHDYLFNNCRVDWPSTSKGHGDYGTVYWDGAWKFALNFQIRF